MKHLSWIGGCLAAVLMSGTALAENTAPPNLVPDGSDSTLGKTAGSFMIRARLIDVIPENTSSHVMPVGGHVGATSGQAPELDFSYFFTDHIAVELIAATTQHTITATKVPALGGSSLQAGRTWVLPPTITAQYHFFPHSKISPYIGAGLNYTIFYDTEAPGSGSPVQHWRLENNWGEAIQAGIDWNVTGNWYVNVDVKQIFVSTRAKLTTSLGQLRAKTALDPTVVGFGIGYKF
jgi:outer membrane protein